ncbi:Divergent major capsid protein [uncultured virus]|nr:Divergent major capsid protein [uncultured virus]
MSASASELSAIINSKYANLYEATAPVYNDVGKLVGGDELRLIYYQQILPTGWYSMTPDEFLSTSSGDKTIYQPRELYDTLMYSYKKAHLPALRIADQHAETYQFRWVDDIGYKLSPFAELNWNGVRIQHKDVIYDIVMSELYVEPGHIKRQKIDVGNVKEVSGWAIEHRKAKIQPMEPWFYSRRSETALQMFKLESLSTITHTYTYTLKVQDLICMRRFVKGCWIDIKPDMTVFHGGPPKKLETPKLYGMFGNIKDEEKIFHYTYDTYYIEDMGVCDCNNVTLSGNVGTIEIESKAVIKSIHWGAENMKAFLFNNKCNFTTDISCYKNGINPIVSNTLSYGTENKFKDLDSEHFEGPLVRKHFSSASRRRGINSFPYSYRPGESGIDPGLVMKAKLECSILPNEDDEPVASYKLWCRLVLMRQMSIRDKKIYFDQEAAMTPQKSSPNLP